VGEPHVRAAFVKQAAICTAAGAPFTGRLCGLIGERLDRSSAIGRRILDWPGNPSHEGDALPLRLAGGLHDMARSGAMAGLTAIYPPNAAPGDAEIWEILTRTFVSHMALLNPWLDGPPQTNEIGRSSGLMAGLLVLSQRFGLPFALYELGASAGLNSLLDRYGYQLGETPVGDPASSVRMAPEWRGVSPPAGPVQVVRRQGVDRHPLDVRDPDTRRRLTAYVWAEQIARIDRLNAALDLAAVSPPEMATDDAAAWLTRALAAAPEPGVCRVVMHTIAFQYFPPESQSAIRDHMDRAGALATLEAPLAWLTYEAEGDGYQRTPVLRLRTWPGTGEAVVLARGHPHGAWYEWAGRG